jgi:hypothetical protein
MSYASRIRRPKRTSRSLLSEGPDMAQSGTDRRRGTASRSSRSEPIRSRPDAASPDVEKWGIFTIGTGLGNALFARSLGLRSVSTKAVPNLASHQRPCAAAIEHCHTTAPGIR